MSALSSGHAEGPGALAGRIDVVGEGDLAGVAGDQRDLGRREGRAEAGDDRVEARLVGHQRVGVALDEDGLVRSGGSGPLARSMR